MDIDCITDTFARPRNPIQETHSTSCTDTSGEGIYEVVDDEPIQVAVTGEKKKIRPKPPTKPKPIGRPSTIIQPRGTAQCNIFNGMQGMWHLVSSY